MTLPKYVAIALCAGFLAGCSPDKELDQGLANLQELKQLLRTAAKRLGHPPARLSDLNSFQAKYPEVYDLVKSGDLVVLWGTPIKMEKDAGKADMVLAYAKDVPTDGGNVLTSGGNVTRMSAL
jgi:hypothetical protein